MTITQGITISEMAKELGVKRHTVEQRLIRFGIKPLTYEALYDPEVLETIKGSKRGRPAKPKP
jgi:predicted ArsR family transcriptional regulator